MITIYSVKEKEESLSLLEEELLEEGDFSIEKRTLRPKKGRKGEMMPDAVLINLEEFLEKSPKEQGALKAYRSSVGIFLSRDSEAKAPEGFFFKAEVFSKNIYAKMLSEEIREAVFFNRLYGTFGKNGEADQNRENIQNLLDRVGIPRHQRGSFYLVDLLLVLKRHHGFVNRLMARAYPMVAEKYAVTAGSVERAIRYSLRTLWMGERNAFLEGLFPKDRYQGTFPPNKEWLVTMLRFLEAEEKRKECEG